MSKPVQYSYKVVPHKPEAVERVKGKEPCKWHGRKVSATRREACFRSMRCNALLIWCIQCKRVCRNWKSCMRRIVERLARIARLKSLGRRETEESVLSIILI